MSRISPDHQWPPRIPCDDAQEMAKKDLLERVIEYLYRQPQDRSEAYGAALRLLRPSNIGAMIGYDVDAKRLEVLVYYYIKMRRKISGCIHEVDDRLPPKAVCTVINSMQVVDRMVVADTLTCDYLDSLQEDDRHVAVISNEIVHGVDITVLKEQLLSFQDELHRIHEQIRSGTLEQES